MLAFRPQPQNTTHTVKRTCKRQLLLLLQTKAKIAFRAILAWHCLCSTCTIVTLALSDPHSFLLHHRWGDPRGNDPTSVTDIDSPAATAPPKRRSGKQAVNAITWQRNRQRDGLTNFKYMTSLSAVCCWYYYQKAYTKRPIVLWPGQLSNAHI